MLYQPKLVHEMWDTWLYYHQGQHYLYYLHKTDGKVWDGMSVAVSQDGVHYEEYGPIIHKREDAEWLGTGSIWPVGDRFILNFSESRQGVQAVFFAESTDLVNWKRLGDAYRSDPDPRWYDNTNTGRWDCIWAVPRPEGGYWGYLTARPWPQSPGMSYESVGRVESDDGVTWRNASPPVFQWGSWPTMNLGEVGAIEKIGSRYYLMVGMGEGGLGGRQVWDYMQGSHGMYAFAADTPSGPFYPVTENFRLLVSNGTYFSRFYPTPDGVLVNHHSIEVTGEGPRIWMAPLKEAVVGDDDSLHLGYWSGNDRVKGPRIDVDLALSTKLFPEDCLGEWDAAKERLEASEPFRGGLELLGERFDLEQGVVLEGTVNVREALNRWAGAGLFVELDQDSHAGVAMMPQTRGRTEIGSLEGGNFSPNHRADYGIVPGQDHHLRLLVRRTMLELYVDDVLVQCWSLAAKPTGRLGLVFESGRVVFSGFKAWRMSLA